MDPQVIEQQLAALCSERRQRDELARETRKRTRNQVKDLEKCLLDVQEHKKKQDTYLEIITKERSASIAHIALDNLLYALKHPNARRVEKALVFRQNTPDTTLYTPPRQIDDARLRIFSREQQTLLTQLQDPRYLHMLSKVQRDSEIIKILKAFRGFLLSPLRPGERLRDA